MIASRIAILVTVFLVGLPAIGNAAPLPSYPAIVQTTPSQQVAALIHAQQVGELRQKFSGSAVASLPLKERDRVVAMLLGLLAEQDETPATVTDPIEWKAFESRAPQTAAMPILRLKAYAAEALQDMAELRVLTDSQVIPPLIEALAHPAPEISHAAYNALVRLTGHRTGHEYWPNVRPGEPERQTTLLWWRSWWEGNKDKQPILDAQTEDRVRQSTLRLARKIEGIKETYPELHFFRVSNEIVENFEPSGSSGPTFPKLEFRPFLLAYRRNAPEQATDCYIRIQARFLHSEVNAPEVNPNFPPHPMADIGLLEDESLRDQYQKLYDAIVPGTDIQIIAEMATHNRKLLAEVHTALAEAGDAAGLIPTSNPEAIRTQVLLHYATNDAMQARITKLWQYAQSGYLPGIEQEFAVQPRLKPPLTNGLVFWAILSGFGCDPEEARKHIEVAKWLVQHGADPNERYVRGRHRSLWRQRAIRRIW